MSDITHKTAMLILGAGPAGKTAAIYGGRAALSPIVVTGPEPGGQLTTTTGVENYPGFREVIQGPWLMQEMRHQAEACGATFCLDTIQSVDLSKRPFICVGNEATYLCDTLIIATGASAKWLGLESETFFRGYGVSSCAVCDGFFYKGKAVAVIGGGNTAVEEALYLTRHARHVTLIHRRDQLRAEKTLQHRLLSHPQITIWWDCVVEEVVGNPDPKQVTGLQVRNLKTHELQHLAVEGVFVAIGHSPNTALFKPWLPMDKEGYLLANPGSCETSIPGVFAAGDVRDKVYRQAITAAGQGCMAALDAEKFLSHQDL